MTARRSLVLPALVLVASLAGCGGGSGTPAATTTAGTVPVEDVGSLDVSAAKDAAGTVTLCGTAGDVAAVRGAVGRFNVDRPRFQASTIGFSGGPARTARELAARARTASAECDVWALPQAGVAGPATHGWLLNLDPYAEERGRDAPFTAVRVGPTAFGARLLRAEGRAPVLVVASASRSPGAALSLLDALSGGRAAAADAD